ncbi:MAG: hypothetical protein QM770_24705 [Tepidisphaeraceae bacterium]
MSDSLPQPRTLGGGTTALWAGVLGLPLLWAMQFQIQYSLAAWACAHRLLWLIHLTTVVAFLAGAALFGFAVVDYRRSLRAYADSLELGPHARGRFLGALGLFVGALFVILIFAQGIPSLLIDPCAD